MNFIKIEDKLVNLEHVSSITELRNKIAIDMDCIAEVKDGNSTKSISYYVYCNDYAVEDIKAMYNHAYTAENFINYKNILININHISVVKFMDETNRVIFNLSHSTTSSGYNKEMRMTSKFIYADFDDSYDYEQFVQQLKNKIKEKRCK